MGADSFPKTLAWIAAKVAGLTPPAHVRTPHGPAPLKHDDHDGLVVDCYLRTAIDLARCTKTAKFDLLQMDWNRTWSAPDRGINCCGS
eukprot:SAG31_NODE_43860_length_265_cov_0.626506_1_plen_87_part_11